jgi:hypothetical protein
MQIRYLFTFSGSKTARLARWATQGPWGHVGIVIEHLNGDMELFEALAGEGFVGPRPLQESLDYLDGIGGKYLLSHPLQLSTDQASKVYAASMAMVGSVTYSKLQLIGMFFSERYGIRLRRSPKRVVCSEACARLVYPFLDMRDCSHPQFDTISPNSLYWRHCELHAGYDSGAVPHD